ncbi:hypothetical protein SADUNF_Sadunf07G0057300 [Salix dunnii]|uniref:COP9 signalosome complex subunit 3 n=1 Tax=Salix dunnii TaxID=1413687 RepID=A0A835K1H3_9ROSI|nr:hypothetical protein SADUNF_Sadunf07G0057300 [Salix dunnii]
MVVEIQERLNLEIRRSRLILTKPFELAVIAVSKRFKDQVLMLEVPMRGVGPLLEAVKKLPSSEHLTALHPDFLQLCLLAKCHKSGLSILEDDMFEPYMQLTSSYSSAKVSELETCIQTNREKFESDNNLGPMKQAVSSMYKRNIQRLTQACLTLSLQDIANTVQLNSPKEAEMHVLQIVVSYAIIPDAKHATIVYIILLLHFL